MSLGRLLLAWLPVAALFVVAPPIGDRWDASVGRKKWRRRCAIWPVLVQAM